METLEKALLKEYQQDPDHREDLVPILQTAFKLEAKTLDECLNELWISNPEVCATNLVLYGARLADTLTVEPPSVALPTTNGVFVATEDPDAFAADAAEAIAFIDMYVH